MHVYNYFKNLLLKYFCDVVNQMDIYLQLLYDMLWRIWKPMYICIEAINAACITNWQKKERGRGKKDYICLQLLKDKKHQTLSKVSWQPVSLT